MFRVLQMICCCRSSEASHLHGTLQGNSADIWSLACTILYIFTQQLPFEGMSSLQIGDTVQAGQMLAIPDCLPLDLQRMLHQCFTWPSTRFTAALMAMKLQVPYLAHRSLPEAYLTCCLLCII